MKRSLLLGIACCAVLGLRVPMQEGEPSDSTRLSLCSPEDLYTASGAACVHMYIESDAGNDPNSEIRVTVIYSSQEWEVITLTPGESTTRTCNMIEVTAHEVGVLLSEVNWQVN